MTQIFEDDLPDDLDLGNEVAIDTETMGLNPKNDRLCLVQICSKQGNVYFVQFKSGEYKAPNLVNLMNNPSVCKIFHYARFDMATMMHHLKDCHPKNIFCTKIGSFLARTYTERHGLKNLVKELLDIEMEKGEQTSYWGADVLTTKQKDYAASDVIYLHKLKEILTFRLERENRLELAYQCNDFLIIRTRLDLLFGENFDIFAHRLNRS